jgi:hypothetical protein
VAHISFVRDPNGNWIEISQRSSLTDSLDWGTRARYEAAVRIIDTQVRYELLLLVEA